MMTTEMKTDKLILDACCGSRMFWFDKENPDVLFADIRKGEFHCSNGRTVVINDAIKQRRRTLIKDVQEMNKRPLTVFDMNHNKIGSFSSVGEAAKEYSILGTSIANQLSGRSKSCNNKIFVYA